MKAKIKNIRFPYNIGGLLTIPLPKSFKDELKLTEHTAFELKVEDGKIVAIPLSADEYDSQVNS